MESTFIRPKKFRPHSNKRPAAIMSPEQNHPQLIAKKKKHIPKTTSKHPLYKEWEFQHCQHSGDTPDAYPCFSCNITCPNLQLPESAGSPKERAIAEFDSLSLSHTFSNHGKITRADFVDALRKDNYCNSITSNLTQNPNFKVNNGLLTFKNKPVLTLSLLFYVLCSLHFSKFSNHCSRHSMFCLLYTSPSPRD